MVQSGRGGVSFDRLGSGARSYRIAVRHAKLARRLESHLGRQGVIMAVPTELSGAKGQILAAEVVTPIIAAMIYGTYKFISLGISWDHFLYTYTPLLGGLVAIAGFFIYLNLVSKRRTIRWKNLLGLLGFLPYFFSLCVMSFLGVYAIYRGVIPTLSIWSIIAGLFWIAVGYRMLNRFYLITEIVRRHADISKQ
jgi:hypothetical protein